jgi:hypothetical protein
VATPDMMNQMNRMVRPGTDPKRQRLFPARRIVRLDPNQMNQTPNLPPPGAGDGPAPEQVPPAPAPQPAPQR